MKVKILINNIFYELYVIQFNKNKMTKTSIKCKFYRLNTFFIGLYSKNLTFTIIKSSCRIYSDFKIMECIN